MSESAIVTSDLVKDYPEVRAVDGLRVTVPSGSIYGFLGRNGAGKTTTIRLLMGLQKPTAGSFSILGIKGPGGLPQTLARIGYVSENKSLFGNMIGKELVYFNRAFFPNWSDELAAKYVDRLQIPMDVPFGKLSAGGRTKLCLLMALAERAELLILDEPTAGLDPVVTDELLKFLIEDHVSEGRTVFLSSHNLSDVERIADWVGIIDHGRLLLESRLDDIRGAFRRITASGSALPTMLNPPVVSARPSGSFCEYVVSQDPDGFVSYLRSQGATVVNISSLNLREIFLQLAR